jgi:hypothetical protein
MYRALRDAGIDPTEHDIERLERVLGHLLNYGDN